MKIRLVASVHPRLEPHRDGISVEKCIFPATHAVPAGNFSTSYHPSMNGQALDLFAAGRYTLETQNIPLVRKALNRPTNDQTPFHYRVFFAKITLEDKLGEQYEPYIFSALNSAKVMLVVGTRKEYFEAVWVKNEWRPFLCIKQKKTFTIF